MQRNLTCIVCPMGCSINVEYQDGQVLNVSGNTCPRGKVYAESEIINPMRTLTTTVKSIDEKVIPVRTDRPIPKGKMFEAMAIINALKVHLPISSGDAIIEDIFGARLIATKTVL